LLLLNNGLIVYPKPRIEDCIARPDFFVVNSKTGEGTIIEITLRRKNQWRGEGSRERKASARKQRQTLALEECGIPYVIFYREDQEMIRENIWSNLF